MVTRSLGGNDDLGWALGVLFRAYRERVGSTLGELPHGPRGYQTLAEVIRGQQPSQLALANHLGIDRTVMTYLVDDLEAAGLVERRPNPADRRQRQVVATDRGRQLVSGLCRRVVEAEDELFGGLDPDEREALRRLLHKAARATGDRLDDPCDPDADRELRAAERSDGGDVAPRSPGRHSAT